MYFPTHCFLREMSITFAPEGIHYSVHYIHYSVCDKMYYNFLRTLSLLFSSGAYGGTESIPSFRGNHLCLMILASETIIFPQ